MMMSVQWGQLYVLRTATLHQGVTHVVVMLDTLSIAMDTHVMVCTDYEASYPSISPFNAVHFADDNECSSGSTNSCQHNCNNILGSYTCQCNTGYRLNIDGRTCTGKIILSFYITGVIIISFSRDK